MTSSFLAYLEKQSRVYLWLAVFVSTLGLGIIDHKIGQGFSISLFYIIPVALASWALGTYEGIFVSVICALIWGATNPDTTQGLAALWNVFAHLGFLLVISLLLSETHTLLKKSRSYRAPIF